MNRPPSILIVDDEVDTCRNLRDIFSDLGYRVEIAQDGVTAMRRVRASRPDVAILDLMMPGMDGLELYQEIKRVSPETVAVVTTAYVNHPRAEESLDAGVWKLVPKPVDLPHLLALVDEALNQPVVLIVDDDTELCLNLWDILRARHYRVGMVHSTLSLQDRLGHGETCQVVVVDLQLPDGDGREVLRWIQQLDCHPRTILITGHRQEFGPEQVLGAGADAVCYKPFDIPQLITTVERLSRIVPGTPPTSHEHAAQDTCH